MNVRLILVGVIFVASLLRVVHISSIPVSLYWDEVSLGYNAYSIAETLRDEHGHFLPILFQAFDDYKMPGYIYTTALSVKLFGLNEFAVRISSALFGIATVILTYFLTKELLYVIQLPQILKKKESVLALLAASLLAISPWHIQFSRTGYEANAGLFFIVLGGYLFLYSMRKTPRLLIATAFVFAFGCYFYRSILLFLPLLLIFFAIVYARELFSHAVRKYTIIAMLVFVLFATPIYYASFFTNGSSRSNDVLVFNNLDEKVSLFQMWAIQSGNGYLGNIFYNQRMVYFNQIVDNYLSHYSPSFLFTSGDPNPRHSTRNMGMMYVWELPFLLIGVYVLSRATGKGKGIAFAWLLLAPLPAAVSIFAPHALRSLNMLPIPQILVALGIVYLFITVKQVFRYPLAIAASTFSLFLIATYIFNYFTVSTFLTATEWGDGYKQLNMYIKEHESEYERIVVSGHYWQPYAYTLFYLQYDPKKFQTEGNNHAFGKYIFGGTSWVKEGPPELGETDLTSLTQGKKSMIVLSPGEYEQQKNPPGLLTEIKDTNNKTVFYVGVIE